MRVTRLALVAFVSLTFSGLVISPTTANAQSVEEAYDATLAAYNQTLNQLEECDLKFEQFQQMAKRGRPADGASREDWDQWANTYIFAVGMYRLCVGMLKREADNLRKKLDELENKSDAAGSGAETKAPPRKDPSDKPKKAPGLLKKGNEDLEKWIIGVRYKIGQVNKMSQEASAEVEKHGSGTVKFEPSVKYDFYEPPKTTRLTTMPPAPGFKAESTSTGGLWTTRLTTPEGRFIVNLPADMRAGDTISGTVFVEPNGQTEGERARNREILDRYQLKISNETLTQPWGSFTWDWLKKIPKPNPNPTPSPTPGGGFEPMQPKGWQLSEGQLLPMPESSSLFVLIGTTYGGDGSDKFTPKLSTPIPESFIEPPSTSEPLPPNKLEVPDFGQGGRDIELKWQFNGDMNDTEIRVGGQAVEKLAESPRSCIFKSPERNAGPTEITIKDGKVEIKRPYRNIVVRLYADKTNLDRGEKTKVKIEFSGLEGIEKNVPVRLDAKGVITMERGNSQNFWIRRTDVQPGGRYVTERTITGQQAGVFSVIATVLDRFPIPLVENARENGWHAKKEGNSFLVNIENVKDPLKGEPVDGEQTLEYKCPQLSQLPYIKRLFFNKGSAEIKTLCVMVTPRIILSEEGDN